MKGKITLPPAMQSEPIKFVRGEIVAVSEVEDLSEKVLEWFKGRAGDHIPNEHYQRLLPELESILEEYK